MRNSEEKLKDISRSVLPATRRAARKAKKELVTTRRQNRRKVNEDLNQIRSYEDAMDNERELTYYPNAKINELVTERQLADNLGAIYSWAEHLLKTKFRYLNNEQKYFAFKAMLPDSLQGRHALGHIRDKFFPSDTRFYFDSDKWHKEYEARVAATRKTLEDNLRKIINTGQDKKYNRILKETVSLYGCRYVYQRGAVSYRWDTCKDCKYRTFEGLHQLDEFIDYLMRHQHDPSSHTKVFMLTRDWT